MKRVTGYIARGFPEQHCYSDRARKANARRLFKFFSTSSGGMRRVDGSKSPLRDAGRRRVFSAGGGMPLLTRCGSGFRWGRGGDYFRSQPAIARRPAYGVAMRATAARPPGRPGGPRCSRTSRFMSLWVAGGSREKRRSLEMFRLGDSIKGRPRFFRPEARRG